jgi:predicted RNA-binding Zn ribbon-like protein
VTTTFRSGNGATWLDFLATQRGRYRDVSVDDVATPAALRAWTRVNGLEPTGPLTADHVERFVATREALHRVAVATLRDERPAAGDVRLLAAALDADRPPRLRATADGLAQSRPADADEALARLVRAAVTDLAGPRRIELHACGDPTCSGIFLDDTGRRRWCSDLQCGNRMRVRAHRANRARVRP